MDELELLRQTFNATEEAYDTEPVVNLPDPLAEPRPTPGFWRRKNNRPPAGSLTLLELDEIPVRTEYDQ